MVMKGISTFSLILNILKPLFAFQPEQVLKFIDKSEKISSCARINVTLVRKKNKREVDFGKTVFFPAFTLLILFNPLLYHGNSEKEVSRKIS